MLKRHLSQFADLMRHRRRVWREGRRLGVPMLRLALHDMSIFRPSEWFAFAHAHYTPDGHRRYRRSDRYDRALARHHRRNDHHWPHWVLFVDKQFIGLDMPDKCMRHLLAEMRATKGDSLADWWRDSGKQIILHKRVRAWLDEQILSEQ